MKRAALLALLIPGLALGAPDEELLGKAQGYPVCPFTAAGRSPHCLVGAFSHFDELFPARAVAHGAPRELKRAAAEPAIAYTFRGQPGTVDSFLAANRNTGLLVLKGDTILVERYQYDRKPEDRFQSMSMAKTVVAMLIGVALNEQLIKSIDDRAEQYVPALKGSPYGETSLRHLLTMSSGVKFREEYDGKDDSAILASRTFGRKGAGGADTVYGFNARENPPGTKFKYASAESQVLGLVLRAAVGRQLSEYLSEKIWRPMGAEADATWLVDGAGYEMGYAGLNATLRDWGRLGLLLANDGAVDGKQIIPAAWVRAMTTAEAPHLQVGTATKNNGYGYQTWLINAKERQFALLGVRGQGVYVDPATRIVVVHTAVHLTQRDPAARGEQFALFFGTLHSLKPQI